MTDKIGYDEIEYEDGAEPIRIRVLPSQARMTISDMIAAGSYTRLEQQISLVARFMIDENGKYMVRCIQGRDGSKRFVDTEQAEALAGKASYDQLAETVLGIVRAIRGVEDVAVPLAKETS